MALSINQIMQVSAPAVANIMGHPTYYLGNIQILQDGNIMAFMHDSVSGQKIVVAWHERDNVQNPKENDKVEFVKCLLENAINSLALYTEEMDDAFLDDESLQDVEFEQ